MLTAGSATDVSKAKVSLVRDSKAVLTGADVESNFEIHYADNIEKGKATIILKAKTGSGYAGVCTGKFTITAMSIEY